MKTTAKILLLLVLSATTVSTAFAANLAETISTALNTLAMEKGDRNLLLLTDAPYVKVDGNVALPFLETAEELTGCPHPPG